MKDTNKHQGLRNLLVKQLKEKGITDKNVLDAIAKIPRHLFIDSSFENFAYQDIDWKHYLASKIKFFSPRHQLKTAIETISNKQTNYKNGRSQ